jgi:hypothetical protein
MFALRLASFCLLNLVVQRSWAASDGLANSPLAVYLHQDPSQSTRVVDYMKRELAHSMLTAGFRVEWLSSAANTDAATLVVVDLRGSCGFPSGSSPTLPSGMDSADLASTSVADGNVLPFTSVNCGNLTRALGPALMGEASARREFLYGRAIARVLEHEMYHILMNSRDHAREGVAKPCFSPSELLTERFEFEQGTLAKLLRKSVEGVGEAAAAVMTEGASGR